MIQSFFTVVNRVYQNSRKQLKYYKTRDFISQCSFGLAWIDFSTNVTHYKMLNMIVLKSLRTYFIAEYLLWWKEFNLNPYCKRRWKPSYSKGLYLLIMVQHEFFRSYLHNLLRENYFKIKWGRRSGSNVKGTGG